MASRLSESGDEVVLLEAYARTHGTTLYRPVGTCRTGEGPQTVVGARLRVHGSPGCG